MSAILVLTICCCYFVNMHICIQAIMKWLACKQSLKGALAEGREKEGKPATTSLEFEFHLQFPAVYYYVPFVHLNFLIPV